ncbi:DUF3159 domain-containing protein [Pseudonocardia acaciae]|uniref:DUF3159 domain-containing protein n=1 Tax=Pseudonocardia acaciae TaxID=551276 RepID=UPI00049030BF|nr:DUF3159 domain-containing protein [Pseudonocardia acaciae]
MSFTVLTQRSLSLFAAVGGWRTVAEAVASRALFLVAHVLTGQVVTSALIAVGGVLVVAVARVWTDRKYWQAAGALGAVGVSALLAGGTGQAVDFYLPGVVISVVAGVVVLLSMVVRCPVIGVAVGAVRGERLGWRRDRARRRLYQACTAVFLVKYCVAVAVMVPLYRAGQVIPLGIASTLLGPPAAGVCVYLCWRILRAQGVFSTV